MCYESIRKKEIRKSFDRQIECFVAGEYCTSKPTIIFIPGAPGSRLNRSTLPHDSNSEEYDYDPAWVSLGMIPFPFLKKAGAAHDLRIDPDGQDAQGHIIVPDGTLHFVLNPRLNSRFLFNNYAKARKTLQKQFNYFEFGCDFRRSVDEAAGWLRHVLNRLRLEVFHIHGSKLEDISILCHSFGGVIGRIFFEYFPAMEAVINKFVTVGTPFFGSPNHFDYLYKGDPKVNKFYPPRLIASIYASFPGPYASTYLPLEIYRNLREVLDIPQYPLVDQASGEPISPYCAAALNRYPDFVHSATRERHAHINDALRIQSLIAGEMPEAISRKTYHLLADGVAMPAVYRWEAVEGKNFRVDGENSPLQAGEARCPGDGSVHHWAACLPQVIRNSGPSRIHRCVSETSHYKMLQSDEVLATVAHLIGHDSLPGVSARLRWSAPPPTSVQRNQLSAAFDRLSQQASTLIRRSNLFLLRKPSQAARVPAHATHPQPYRKGSDG